MLPTPSLAGSDVRHSDLAKSTEGYSGADLHLACRDAAMAPMRKAVLGRSPAEIVEMHALGSLEGVVSKADFAQVPTRACPSRGARLSPSALSDSVSPAARARPRRQALKRTQPSTAAAEHVAYKAWNDEYGCK